ncbi:MAG TPA: hypothetical protein VMU83_06595 [Hanamia sp.]|nr:hypothetical protein [Hanamia sp.]
MKRIVLPILFTFLVILTFGQDIKKATSLINDKKYDEAKTQIDGILAKDPNNAEALYLNSKVLVLMANQEADKGGITGDPYGEAFTDFKKAMLDTTDPKLTLMVIKDNYQPIFGVYSGFFAEGAKAFNDAAPKGDTAGFAKAMNLFIKADEVGKYLAKNKWARIGDVDTTLVLNIAKAALNAKRNDVARKYFEEIADAHIKGLHNAKDTAEPAYELPYQWLTLDFKQKGDSVNMIKYATIGKELYPNDDYFDFVEMDYYREKDDKPALFKKYDELTAKHPDSLVYHLNYATEIFSYVFNSDPSTVISNEDALLTTLKDQLEKAHSIDPHNSSVNLLYSQYYYNNGIIVLQNAQKIRGAKLTPDQQKQKKDLNDQGKTDLQQAIPYAEAAMNDLQVGYKSSEKSKYKSAVNLLENIYQSLGDNANLKKYQDLYDGADAKFVN